MNSILTRLSVLLATAFLCLQPGDLLEGEVHCSLGDALRLDESEGTSGDRFGAAVAISGDIAVVGIPEDDELASNAGALSIYRKVDGGWAFEEKLTASDGAALDRFGASVSTDGKRIVCGAWGNDESGTGAGAVYSYAFDGTKWVEEQKLAPADLGAFDFFGSALSLDGERLAVSATGDGEFETSISSGAVYLFEWKSEQWVQVDRFEPEESKEVGFGQRVSLSGDSLVVGARNDATEGLEAGAAYLYERGSTGDWSFAEKLTATDAESKDHFGSEVRIVEDMLFIGAPYWYSEFGSCARARPSECGGALYVFERTADGWVEAEKLMPSDPSEGGLFGSAVAMTGGQLVVTAPFDAEAGVRSGAIYHFDHVGEDWTEIAKRTLGDGADDHYFAFAIAAQDDDVLVGALLDDDEAGAAYIYPRSCAVLGFIRGDANGSEDVSLGDVLFELKYLFQSGEQPGCLESCDLDANGTISIGDPIVLLRYMFLGGAAPEAPFPKCGEAAHERLGCAQPLECAR